MTDQFRARLYLHFAILCWGFTAILGKLITLPTLPLVWWRVVITVASLLLLMPLAQLRAVSRADAWRMFGIGTLVGLHWLCFYGSVKLANASVAVVSIATCSLFAAILEPILLKTKLKWYEIGLALLILPGMALVAGNLESGMSLGFAVGILGAFLAALFSILNKKMIHAAPPFAMTFIELGAIVVLFGLLLPGFYWQNPTEKWLPNSTELGWLLVLGLGCTTLPFALSLFALKRVSAFTFNLVVNLEPVYGVLLAGLILHENEELKPGFYLGVAIVVFAIFVHPFLRKRFETEKISNIE